MPFKIVRKLTRELNRSHPYRHFKDSIYNLGIEQLYYIRSEKMDQMVLDDLMDD